ncbi:hypothetical protein D3C81_1021090 [compost metagenome]
MRTFETEHSVQIAQMTTTQQADIQRHIQARTETHPLLHQHRQIFLHLIPTHQHMADAAEQIGRLARNCVEHVPAVEDRAARRNQAVGRARWQYRLIRSADESIIDDHVHIRAIHKHPNLLLNTTIKQPIIITQKLNETATRLLQALQ